MLPLWRVALMLSCVGASVAEETLTKGLSDAEVDAGGTVTLRCDFANRTSPVLWTRGRTASGSARVYQNTFGRYVIITTGSESDVALSHSSITITNAKLDEDDAAWSCQVPTAALNSRAQLTVRVAPQTAKITAPEYVEADSVYNITCVGGFSRPAATVQWTVNGEAASGIDDSLSDGKLVATESLLTLRPEISDRNLNVECRVSHPSLATNLVATRSIPVYYAPVITLRPSKDVVNEYDTISLTCHSDSNPAIALWRWYRGDTLIPEKTKAVLDLNTVGVNLDGVVFSCEARNLVGASRANYTVSVHYRPQLDRAAFRRVVGSDLNAAVTLDCPIRSNPPPTVVWTRESTGVIVERNSPSLTIPVVTAPHVDSYTCTASVRGFDTVSATIKLVLNGPPRLGATPTRQLANIGFEARLECRVTGQPAPQRVMWYRTAARLLTSDRYIIDEPNSEGISYLRVRTMHTSDLGVYNCTAENAYGVGFIVITLAEHDTFQLSYLVGAGAGVIVFLILILVFVICYCHRKRHRKSPRSSTCSGADKKDPDLDSTHSSSTRHHASHKHHHHSSGSDDSPTNSLGINHSECTCSSDCGGPAGDCRKFRPHNSPRQSNGGLFRHSDPHLTQARAEFQNGVAGRHSPDCQLRVASHFDQQPGPPRLLPIPEVQPPQESPYHHQNRTDDSPHHATLGYDPPPPQQPPPHHHSRFPPRMLHAVSTPVTPLTVATNAMDTYPNTHTGGVLPPPPAQHAAVYVTPPHGIDYPPIVSPHDCNSETSDAERSDSGYAGPDVLYGANYDEGSLQTRPTVRFSEDVQRETYADLPNDSSTILSRPLPTSRLSTNV